jgi:conjugative relaxase-like TrwC/TraI family protein
MTKWWLLRMTVSIRRMTLGSGYKYLMGSVAQSDGASQHASALTRYYAESGTPPGRFIGQGLGGLGHGIGIEPGTQVTEEHLFRMLGMVQDPLTGEQLGRPPRVQKAPYAERVKTRIGAETAGLKGDERDAKVLKIKTEERIAEAKIARAVAGFDLTFSAPKSVSVAWALADGGTQALIYAAHQEALAYVLRYAEQCVVTSRSGKHGVVQEEIRGVVGAAFDHWDSRAGDPQLHTHVVVMNRAQSGDGVWRTLDSRGMFRATVGLSEMYNGVLSDFLTQALGWGWESSRRLHSHVPKYEVAGVPEELQRAFSTRSASIEVATNEMIPDFVASHGRPPNSREMLRLRQRATLQTRPDKHVHSLAEQVTDWRKRAQVLLDTDPVPWVATLRDRNDLPLLRADDLTSEMLTEVGATAVNVVAEKRSTFSRANVFAEVLRQIHGVRFVSADDRMAVVERTVGLALDKVLLVSAPELAHTPARFTRPDGTSQFRARGFEVYTTQALLDAEARLLDAGRCTQSPRVAIRTVADVAAENLPGRAHALSADQAFAVEQIAASGRVLDVLVGPAGTGKSTTMGGLRAVWERQFGPGSVVGLAPSAAAAQVLAEEFGVATENTSKWLTEHARQPDRLREIDSLRARLNRAGPSMSASMLRKRIDNLSMEVDKWSLRSGQLVVVDEASLAGTFALDTLTEQARNAGAKVVLVGDWAQLSPVEAGGAFHLLVHDRDLAPELADVRRFTHGWEKAASIDLRVGRPGAVDVYEEHDRVEGGDRESMLDLLYDAWRADVAAGKRSLMIASDNDTVAALNERARAHRVAVGEVRAQGIQALSGATIAVGDLVVTRQNNRLLSCGRGWVKNGDQWLMQEVAADGAVTVARTRGSGMPGGRQVVLPADYVRQHVELGYATTAHRAQGRTVDSAHAFVSVTTQREVLYVAATRGRESNRLYVDTMYDPDADTQHGLPAERDAGDVLRQVLEARGADLSATETIAADWVEQHGIVRMWAEYDTIAGVAQRQRYDDLLTSSCATVATEQVEGLRDSAAYGPLLAALREAKALGLDVEQGLPRLVNGRTLSSADVVASVLHGRVDRWIRASSPPRRAAADRIVGLFPRLTGITDHDMARALDDRQTLIEQRAREVATTAVEHRQPWAAQLGSPPSDPVRRELWLRRLDTVAAYRERWGITDRTILGTREPTSLEQEAQRRLAQGAVQGALSITRDERVSVGAVGQPVESQASRGAVEL